MAWLNRGLLALALAGVVSCAAYGSPRESVTFTNQVSNDPAAGGGLPPYQQHSFAGGYPVRFIVVSATLSHIASGTFGLEAIIQVNTAGGQSFVINPLQVGSFAGTASVTDLIYPVPVDVPDAVGSWTFRFLETYEDVVGNDSNWDTITFTLDDGAPASEDLGILTQQGRVRVLNEPLSAGQIRWYRIEVPAAIDSGAGTYLDIDTIGSLPTAGTGELDTEIGLYASNGARMANDDDGGSSVAGWSMLTFGAGTRPSENGGDPYDGSDGALAPGVYYLSVSGYNSSFGNTSWNVASTSTYTGTLAVRIRTNVGAPRAKDLGEVSRNPIHLRNIPLAAGQVRWYRFDVAENVAAALSTWFDIDTEGSTLVPTNDTELGLYTVSGGRITADDDGGSGNLSQLTFGAGTRPPVGNGAPYDGRFGPLPAGTYYLSLSGWPTNFGATGWNVSSTSTYFGAAAINIRTNTGDPATCPADLDDGSGSGIPDGGITIDDLLYFLGHYEGGC